MVPAAAGGIPVIIPGPTVGQIVGWLMVLSCLAAASIGSAWLLRDQGRAGARQWVWAWVGAAIAAGVVLLLWRGEQLGWHGPLRHRFDMYVLLGMLVAGVGLYVDLWWRWEVTGAAFAPLAGLIEVAALTGLGDMKVLPGPQAEGAAFYLHVMAFVLAAASLAVAGMAGGFYLMIHRRLKRPRPLAGAPRLPSLEALERVNVRAAALGFPLLTIGLWLGMLQIWDQPDRLAWLTDPKVVGSMVVWLVYAALLHMQHVPKYRGVRVAWLSVLSMGGLVLTFAVSSLVVTRHP